MNEHELRPLSRTQLVQLMADLNPARVANRKQSGQTLSYLEAWDVKASLIRVFGFGGFSAEVLDSKILRADEVPNSKGTGNNWKITAQATVRLTIHQLGAVYSETAVGGSSQPDFTESADMALKTSESDALKRAAIYLGTTYGLSLYSSGATTDVVRRVLEPGQAATLRGDAEKAAEETGADVQTGEVPPEPTAEATAAAQAQVQGAFS